MNRSDTCPSIETMPMLISRGADEQPWLVGGTENTAQQQNVANAGSRTAHVLEKASC